MPVHSLSPALTEVASATSGAHSRSASDRPGVIMDIYQGTQVGQAPLSLVLLTSIATL